MSALSRLASSNGHEEEDWLNMKRVILNRNEEINSEDKVEFLFNSRSLVIMPTELTYDTQNRFFIEAKDFYHPNIGCVIPLTLDKLIGRWLKLKKYFGQVELEKLSAKVYTTPEFPAYLSAFILLQPNRIHTIPRLLNTQKKPHYFNTPFSLKLTRDISCPTGTFHFMNRRIESVWIRPVFPLSIPFCLVLANP